MQLKESPKLQDCRMSRNICARDKTRANSGIYRGIIAAIAIEAAIII